MDWHGLHNWFKLLKGIAIELQFVAGSDEDLDTAFLLNSSPAFEFAAYTVAALTNTKPTVTIQGEDIDITASTLNSLGNTVVSYCLSFTFFFDSLVDSTISSNLKLIHICLVSRNIKTVSKSFSSTKSLFRLELAARLPPNIPEALLLRSTLPMTLPCKLLSTRCGMLTRTDRAPRKSPWTGELISVGRLELREPS